MTKTAMIETVNRYVGIPYADASATRDGCNCLGLVVLFCREVLGREIPFPPTQNATEVRASALSAYFDRIDVPAFGDVVTMPGVEGEQEHVGIWTPLGVLHSHRKAASILTPARRLQIREVYRLRAQ
jgi:cell wall-associated NlpC family hydrolase